MLKLEKKFLKRLSAKQYQSSLDLDWFVAISAGVDSLALLHLLQLFCTKAKKKNLFAIHFNHQLNPDSDSWQKHCQDVCNQLSVPLIIDSPNQSKCNQSKRNQVERKNKITVQDKSFENEARNLRYSSFFKHLPNRACLFLAHHQGDQIETFLFRLARGSSFRGLSAMDEHRTLDQQSSFLINHPNKSQIYLKRPLLNFCYKRDLSQYAREKGFDWIDDQSNQDLRIKRNLIRHQVLPKIKNIHPQAEKNLLKQIEKHRQNSDLIEEVAQEDIAKCLEHRAVAAYLSIDKLKKLSKVRLQNLIYQFAHQNWGFYFDDTKQIKQLIAKLIYQSQPLDEFHLKNIRLIHYDSCILAFNANQLIEKPKISQPLQPQPLCPHSRQLKIKSSHGFLSFEKVKRMEYGIDIKHLNQLELLENQKIKKIKLAQKKHHQRLNKLFQEYNIPRFFRHCYPIIGLNNQVIALPNIGLCEGYQARQQLKKNKIEAVRIRWNFC